MKKVSLLIALSFLASISFSFAQETVSYKVGMCEIILLSDMQGENRSSILIGATPEMIDEYIPTGSFQNAVNAFLVKMPRKNILIDAGYGRKLLENLNSKGITPEQIDMIFLTHMHKDHIGGLLNGNNVVFPNAELYISEPEYEYWTSDEAMLQLPEDKHDGFLQARRVISTYPVTLFQPNTLGVDFGSIYLGIQAIAAYGHTPGHTMYLIESGDENLLIWGDLTHAIDIQMPYPGVAVTYDSNPDEAIISRKKTLEYITGKNIPVAGMHIAFPGMGNVKQTLSGGYEFIPLSTKKQ